jgi:hypothetical protein
MTAQTGSRLMEQEAATTARLQGKRTFLLSAVRSAK